MNNKIKIGFSFLVLSILIVGSFFLFKKKSDPMTDPVTAVDNFSTSVATTTLIAGEKANEYRNKQARFYLIYPENMEYKVYDEGNNSSTILFEEKDGDKSFQVFLTPFGENTIPASRLKIDIPSGTYTKPEEAILKNGTRALIFFSNGPAGELREVWFIKNGYLFEITTYKEYDPWLGKIVESLNFI